MVDVGRVCAGTHTFPNRLFAWDDPFPEEPLPIDKHELPAAIFEHVAEDAVGENDLAYG